MLEKISNPETIAIFGTGYVGIVTAATLVKKGHRVVCVDIDEAKVETINNGKSPVFEPGVEDLIEKGIVAKRLEATTDPDYAIAESRISFICVGTPSGEDGGIDLSFIERVSDDIGRALRDRDGYHVVVVKSTVVPSTSMEVILPRLEKGSKKSAGEDFGLACNPEFLREGQALQDSLDPDRIVIGGLDDRSRSEAFRLFRDMEKDTLLTDLTTAEMIKYASNAFLASKVALSNEIANICSAHGIDVYEVMHGVGLDERIGPHFLRAGAGFGGSCFPKDIRALVRDGEERDLDLRILPAILAQNDLQPLMTVRLLKEEMKDLSGKDIALMGVTFKPETDDIRETRALPILEGLMEEGCSVRVFDPNETALDDFMALTTKIREKGSVTRVGSMEKALEGAHGAIFQTEWKEFRELAPSFISDLMATPVVIDGRRTFDPEKMIHDGIRYRAIGWKNL